MTGRRRMSRVLPASETARSSESSGEQGDVRFPTRPGSKSLPFRLGEIEMGDDIKTVFRYAIEHHPMPIAHGTQRRYWSCIKSFAKFAKQEKLGNVRSLDTACVERYRRWLEEQRNEKTGKPWSEWYRGKQLIELRELIRTVKSGKPELLPSELVFPTNCYPEGAPKREKPRRHLTRGQLTSLIWACQRDIQENTRRFEKGRRILAGKECEVFPGMRDILLSAETLAQTERVTKRGLKAKGFNGWDLERLGTSDRLRSHLAATALTLAPIAILLMIQLAGNVDAIRRLRVNCIRTDEMDERWAIIEWDKPRAGPAPAGTQRRFGDRTKRFGAPALIDTAMAMTAPRREHADKVDREHLFICEKTKERPRLLSDYDLANNAHRFVALARKQISEWNAEHPEKPREQITEFNLRDIRASVALEHYLASGGDIRKVQQVLNHRQGRTTSEYIEGATTKDKNVQILVEVQRQITRRAADADDEKDATSEHGEYSGRTSKVASPGFTHECRAPHGESGALCSHFQQCLDCPGLVIPKTAEHLARLLQAQETFRTAKERLHPQRWESLYARSYATLTQRILPKFPAEMVPEARQLMDTIPPLPDLE